MKSFLRSLVVTALVLPVFAVFASGAQAQFSYTFYPNNATIHSEVTTDFAIVGYASGSYDDDFVPHFVSPSSPTIQVVSGANVTGEIDAFNQSIINILGGEVGFVVAYDSTHINVSGGSTSVVLSIGNAVVNMSGGSVSDLEGQGTSMRVTGGNVDLLVANSHTDTLGNSLGSCIVDVTGGTFGEADAFNDGILNLRGGNLGPNLYAAFGGTINFFGSGLSATLLDPSFNNRFSQYSLSGRLADGTVLTGNNLFVENDGVTYGHSSFHLITSSAAPEPGSLALLGFLLPLAGGARLLRSKRRSSGALSHKGRERDSAALATGDGKVNVPPPVFR